MTVLSRLPALLAATALALTAAPAFADSVRSAPEAVPIVDTIPAARDVPFPGTIKLDIDATDLDRRLFKVTQEIPVPAGTSEMVLLLPQWLPGKHAARGPINLMGDLKFKVDGKPASWTRDPVDVHAFRVPLPEGAKELTASFVHTSPLQSSEGRVTMTFEMLNLQWDSMSLYPAGHYVRQVKVAPTVTFPKDWQVFTALDGKSIRGNRVSWDTVDYETLVDSPVFAGKHAKGWDLGHGVALNVVADRPELLEIAPENLATYRKLVSETLAVFGHRHFDHYTFLLALTDRMGDIGLEHQRSSENAQGPETLTKWAEQGWDRNVIAHEFVHSWNGKYRRPARMWTPDYRTPMRNNLLWVYEGQTQFWGWILAARSGIQSKEIVLGALANQAGAFSVLPGREWRSVEDTTFDPIVDARRPQPYASLNRNEDYYNEGMLVWLEADQVIREGTGGAKGLADFARAFFGGIEGDVGQATYEFDDVVAALAAVYPYDWAKFLHDRFQVPSAPAPLAGIEKAGYRLVWRTEPNPYARGVMTSQKNLPLTWSLGVTLDSEGRVTSTYWDGPAFKAGLVTGSQVISVGDAAYSPDAIREAITAAAKSKKPIELLVKRGDRYRSVPIAWYGGLKYPWLEPVNDRPQPLDLLLAPQAGS